MYTWIQEGYKDGNLVEYKMNIYLDTGWKLGGTLDECIPEYRMETRRNTR